MSKVVNDCEIVVQIADPLAIAAFASTPAGYGKIRLARYEDAAKSIRRHVDDVADVTIRRIFVCEHCEAPWTEQSSTYNGGCCADDAKNEPLEGGA